MKVITLVRKFEECGHRVDVVSLSKGELHLNMDIRRFLSDEEMIMKYGLLEIVDWEVSKYVNVHITCR